MATATVTNVAASRSCQSPLRLAIIHAASGRKSATSSGTACGASASSRTPGVVPSWSATDAAPPPITYAWVQSENVVAQTTKAMANGPAFSCTQRETPLRLAAESGRELPAMKPATQASACRASTSELR
jgi:hypothetical protein